MAKIKERVAYLQGLQQGLSIGLESNEGKILINIIEVMDGMADELNNIQMGQADLEAYVESMDEDLSALEEEVYASVGIDDF